MMIIELFHSIPDSRILLQLLPNRNNNNKITYLFSSYSFPSRESSLSNRLNLHLNVHNFHFLTVIEKGAYLFCTSTLLYGWYTRAKKGPEESCATITHLLSVPLISKKLDLLAAPSIVHFFSGCRFLGKFGVYFSLSAFMTISF